MQKILIASDHAGFELKEKIKKALSGKLQFIDLGTNSTDSVDYPDFGVALGKEIEKKTAEFGILVCGSGIGINIAANRNPAVRAAQIFSEETAKLSRQHNNANVISIGSRLTSKEDAVKYIETFLATPFEGGRHENRVKKLSC